MNIVYYATETFTSPNMSQKNPISPPKIPIQALYIYIPPKSCKTTLYWCKTTPQNICCSAWPCVR